jgi:hypothetical protein
MSVSSFGTTLVLGSNAIVEVKDFCGEKGDSGIRLQST